MTKRLNYNQAAVRPKNLKIHANLLQQQSKSVKLLSLAYSDWWQTKGDTLKCYPLWSRRTKSDKDAKISGDPENYRAFNRIISKLSLQYGPPMGIYVMPMIGDFFTWQFYLFLREGYYKDAKLKGQLKFDHINSGIQAINFLTPVYHPFVDFKSGNVDILKLISNSNKKSLDLFVLFSSLKQMFLDQGALYSTDSFNAQASKTYKKSEVLFVEKVFKTTIIPAQQALMQIDIQNTEESYEEQNEEISQMQRTIEAIKAKIHQILPSSIQIPSFEHDKTHLTEVQNVESKVQRLMKAILEENFLSKSN